MYIFYIPPPTQKNDDHQEAFNSQKLLESTETVSCLLKTGKTIWVGTTYGLEIFDNKSGVYERRLEDMDDDMTLRGESIMCLHKDSENNIWVGTYNGGLRYRIYEDGFNRYTSNGQPNSIRGSSIRAICNGPGNDIYTGSAEGFLCRFDPGKNSFTDLTGKAGIPYGSTITDIDFFDGLLWISTDISGVFVFDPARQQSIRHYEIPSIKCMSINNTSSGKIYVGTDNGLYTLNKEADSFELVDILGDIFIHDVYEDTKGRCWICSYGKGLSYIDPKTQECHSITIDDKGNELDAQNIINLSEDSNGAIWVGSNTGILSKIVFESNSLRYQISNYNLNSEHSPVFISGIVDGGNGQLWVATTHGLVEFDSNKGKKVMTYLQNDNIVGSHLCFGGEYIDRNGIIYFGTNKGMIRFDPEFVTSKYARTSLYITDILVTSRNGDKSKGISTIATDRIKIRQKEAYKIRITYSTMNYADPNKKEYECILTRAGARNRTLTSSPYITYYGLRPGKYHFTVNYSERQDDAYSRHLYLHITAPWYSSLVAKGLYFVVFVACITLMSTAVSRRKKIEAERIHQIQEAQKEKELIQEKMAFMTNITHEIRTPVSVILILLEKLITDDETPDDVKEGLNSIRINAERLRKHCNDILDLRKADNLRSHIVKKDEDIVALIKKSESSFSTVIKNRGLTLDSDYPADPLIVNCDNDAVETIICNLLSNAVKFAESRIFIGCKVNGNIVRINVDSDGEHIAVEHSEKIFDAFYQIQRPDNYGSGVGLTFARQLASMHDGKLFLDTTNTEINSFILEIPLNNSAEKIPDTAKSLSDKDINKNIPLVTDENGDEGDERFRILVAEDNEIMRNVLTEELSRQYNVCCASDGKEALEIVKQERIDLVVSDIMMPEMDGCELCNAIKCDIELSHIPILLMTAAVGVETNLMSLRAGADAYIEKPFKMEILSAQINNLFKNRDIRNKQFVNSPLAHINYSSINKTEYEFVNSLHTYILNHISDPVLSIDRLANEMSMSKASLSRKVKANTGLTVNEYVRLCRLKKAVELLSENNYRINEVAYLVGYTSASYFTKIFQKQFGKLPSEFVNS